MEEKEGHTLDGTVNLNGGPVLSSTTGKWKACVFILANQLFERFAYFGVGANLVIYMTSELHKDMVSAVTSVNNWSGTAWMTPVLGAYIADSYLGRFWTITFALLIYATGMGLLVLTTTLECFKPTCRNEICKASTTQLALFYVSIYTIALGSGILKPNLSTFGADQFDDFRQKEKVFKVSFFNWWFFNTACGTLAATLFLVYIQERFGWGLGYGVSAIGFLLGAVTFFSGLPMYRHKPRHSKSHAKEFFRVPIVAFRNRNLHLPSNPSELHEFALEHYIAAGRRQIYHTPRFRFLDKAAIKSSRTRYESNAPCTVTQVETNKAVLGMIGIWLLTIIPGNFWAVEVTMFVKQGTTMDRKLGRNFEIPAASLWGFVVVTILICLPIYDCCFVPFMRRRSGHHRGLKMLHRVAIGFSIQVLAAAVMYVVELARMDVIREKHITTGAEVVPMSIFWLVPQHVLLGLANTFIMGGLLEFFYDESPEEMKVLGTAFYTSTVAAGKYSNSLVVSVIDKFSRKISGNGKSWLGNNLNDSHLDYYYAILVVISALNLGIFLWVQRRYIYKKENETPVNGIEILKEET
ncbi:solute carrier family 15 [Vigna unguiculata]|uniref:Solute carrier family 15 n=1 Tax=Vigna unguiculata TaxID=3917 RepID=A0A4D6NU89_VIGUN|nr:solute carrier family 15 [Vigna unguiculata]